MITTSRALEGGQHHGVDVLGLVGGVEQRLGAVGELAGGRVEHDPSHLLADRGVAGLEGEQGGVAALLRAWRPGPATGCLSPDVQH